MGQFEDEARAKARAMVQQSQHKKYVALREEYDNIKKIMKQQLDSGVPKTDKTLKANNKIKKNLLEQLEKFDEWQEEVQKKKEKEQRKLAEEEAKKLEQEAKAAAEAEAKRKAGGEQKPRLNEKQKKNERGSKKRHV